MSERIAVFVCNVQERSFKRWPFLIIGCVRAFMNPSLTYMALAACTAAYAMNERKKICNFCLPAVVRVASTVVSLTSSF